MFFDVGLRQPKPPSKPVLDSPPTEPFILHRLTGKPNRPETITQTLLDIEPNDPTLEWLEPNTHQLNISKEGLYARGLAFEVYRAKTVEGKNAVVKIERKAIGKNKDGYYTYHPWITLGIGRERSGLYTLETAKERREVHSGVKSKLESVGIKTARYIGSFLLGSNTPIPIDYIVANKHELPRHTLYAEVWEDPGGLPLGMDEAQLELLYGSPEGRGELRKLVDGLLALAKEGYVYDVGVGIGPTSVSPSTADLQLPYARNFIQTAGGKIVAIDFNMGLDLRQEKWWDPNIIQSYIEEKRLFFTGGDGRTYLSVKIEEDFNNKIASIIHDMPEDVGKREKNILESQLSHWMGQMFTAISMSNEINRRENLAPSSHSSEVKIG